MCVRFTLFSDGAELARLFGCGFELPLQPRYDIAPGQPVPVVRLAEDQPGARQVALLGLGLVPAWASDPGSACGASTPAPKRPPTSPRSGRPYGSGAASSRPPASTSGRRRGGPGSRSCFG